MKALVKYDFGPGNMEIRDIPEPQCGEDQVKIKVIKAGICGSDLHIYHNDALIAMNPPVVVGHEFSGTVVEVGSKVDNFKVGDRVVSETAFSYCGRCDQCIEGYYNLCDDRHTIGYWENGAFTEYIVVPSNLVHIIPDNVSDTLAAMVEPLACVCHAVYDLCSITAHDVVLVSGPGAIGLLALQIAKSEGAIVIISGIGDDKERLELARSLGADYTVNVEEQSLSDLVKKIVRPGKKGVDVVLECSGAPAAINSALEVVKKRGYFVQIGLPGRKISFDIEKVCYKELKFSGSLASRKHSWLTALDLLQKEKINLEPLVNMEFPIEDWKIAFDKFEKKEAFKILLVP